MIRPSTPDDAETIAAVHVRSARAGLADIHPPEALAALDVEARIPLWRERLPLVAEEGGEVVGLVHVGPNDDEPVGEVYRLFVAPECWGRGVGRALLARGLEQLRAAGFSDAVLWVHADNRRARRFYEAAGWRPDGGAMDNAPFGRPVRLLRYRIALEPWPNRP